MELSPQKRIDLRASFARQSLMTTFEAELAENGWLVCDATPDLVFRTEDDRKWEAGLATLGVSAVALSSEGGRA